MMPRFKNIAVVITGINGGRLTFGMIWAESEKGSPVLAHDKAR